jgi:hypothetical protein
MELAPQKNASTTPPGAIQNHAGNYRNIIMRMVLCASLDIHQGLWMQFRNMYYCHQPFEADNKHLQISSSGT